MDYLLYIIQGADVVLKASNTIDRINPYPYRVRMHNQGRVGKTVLGDCTQTQQPAFNLKTDE